MGKFAENLNLGKRVLPPEFSIVCVKLLVPISYLLEDEQDNSVLLPKLVT